MPEISVILPAYNVDQYIDECVTSLTRQTFQDFEIIIINDGSKDQTQYKSEHWVQMDKRVKLINNENQGAGAARNCGLLMATGEYVIFIDPDDSCSDDMLQKLHQAIVTNDADIALCDYYEVQDLHFFKKNEIKITENKKVSISNDNTVLYKINPQPWNKLFRRNLLINNSIMFPTKYRREDLFVVCCSVLKAKYIVRVAEPLYFYKVMRPGSATHANINTLLDVLKILELVNQFYINENAFDQYYEELEMVSIDYGLGWYTVALQRCKFLDIKNITNEYGSYFKKHFRNIKHNKYFHKEKNHWSIGKKVSFTILLSYFGPYLLYFLFKMKYLIKR